MFFKDGCDVAGQFANMAGLSHNHGHAAVILLSQSLADWGSEAFERTFQREVAQLPASVLPLQAGLAHSSAVADEPFKVVILNAEWREQELRVRAGIFYSGIIAGCNCADDQTPPDLQQEYCELEFLIDGETAATTVRLLSSE